DGEGLPRLGRIPRPLSSLVVNGRLNTKPQVNAVCADQNLRILIRRVTALTCGFVLSLQNFQKKLTSNRVPYTFSAFIAYIRRQSADWQFGIFFCAFAVIHG